MALIPIHSPRPNPLPLFPEGKGEEMYLGDTPDPQRELRFPAPF